VIPSSLFGLVLFVATLSPGFVYVLRTERVVPAATLSAFRETIRVVFASIACLTVSVLVFAVLRALLPRGTPDVHGLVADPSAYAKIHYVQLTWWTAGLLLLATLLGAAAGDRRVRAFARRASSWTAVRRIAGHDGTDIADVSAWYNAFRTLKRSPEGPTLVGVKLSDGTYVTGTLVSWSSSTKEDGDREIVLTAPLDVSENGVTKPIDAHLTVIAARNIQRLDVKHFKN
jgi:hypothetical protein